MIGLTLSDTYDLTLDEFAILYEEWDKYRTALFRTSWEQTRFMAHCSLLPHTKRGLNPMELLQFEWDKEKGQAEIQPVTKEDFERIKKRFAEN